MDFYPSNRKSSGCGVGVIVVLCLIAWMFSGSGINRTLSELRATFGGNDLKGEPDETGTNDSGNKYYQWKFEGGLICVIVKGTTDKIMEVNCIVIRKYASDDRFKNAAAFARLGLLVESLSNHAVAKGTPEMEKFLQWTIDNADKKGALSGQGGLTVWVKEVMKVSDGVVSSFNFR
jgi:hypothetical protein